MIRLIKEISPKQREWRNHPEIMRWTRGSELLSEEDQRAWLYRIDTDKSIQMFGIAVGESKKAWSIGGVKYQEVELNIGTCGLTSINMLHKTAEFSLLIGPEYQRNGYGRGALKELLKYGFKSLGLETIYGETFVYPTETNPAYKMFQEMGFKEEGKLRKRYYKQGEQIDTIAFSMLRSEFHE